MSYTYSFLDTHAAIVGPGGGFSLGSGVGMSQEGIAVDPSSDIDAMEIGADGTPQHSLVADRSGTITLTILKTSPVNAQLSAMVALQRASSANHGQNTITITNTNSGDVITCESVAFKKVPAINFKKEAGTNTWEFNAGIINVALGAGI